MNFKLVESVEEILKTDEVILNAYHSNNLIGKNDSSHIDKIKMKNYIRAYGGSPSKPILTMSAVISSNPQDLPSIDTYPKEVTQLIEEVGVVAEFCLLADLRKKSSYKDLLNIVTLIGAEIIIRGVKDIILTVHPDYYKLYGRFFHCKKLGPEKYYSGLHAAPAQLMHCDLRQIHNEAFSASLKTRIQKNLNERAVRSKVSR